MSTAPVFGQPGDLVAAGARRNRAKTMAPLLGGDFAPQLLGSNFSISSSTQALPRLPRFIQFAASSSYSAVDEARGGYSLRESSASDSADTVPRPCGQSVLVEQAGADLRPGPAPRRASRAEDGGEVEFTQGTEISRSLSSKFQAQFLLLQFQLFALLLDTSPPRSASTSPVGFLAGTGRTEVAVGRVLPRTACSMPWTSWSARGRRRLLAAISASSFRWR